MDVASHLASRSDGNRHHQSGPDSLHTDELPQCTDELAPIVDLRARRPLEQVLDASYRQRGWQLRTVDDPWSLVPFAFYFEWVGLDDAPANPEASANLFTYPCVEANPILVEIACRDLDRLVQQTRPGIASRCYDDAFSTFRIDEDDTWHLVPYGEAAAALFHERHEIRRPELVAQR